MQAATCVGAVAEAPMPGQESSCCLLAQLHCPDLTPLPVLVTCKGTCTVASCQGLCEVGASGRWNIAVVHAVLKPNASEQHSRPGMDIPGEGRLCQA